MPTVLRWGPYRFYFYSHEPNEPPHVHVDRDELSAKFWLDPIGLARNFGFSAREVNTVQSLVETNHKELLEASNGHFGSRSEEHTSELQSLRHLVCRLLLEKK